MLSDVDGIPLELFVFNFNRRFSEILFIKELWPLKVKADGGREKKTGKKRGKKRNEKVNDNAGFSFLCSQRNGVCSKGEVIYQAWDTVFYHQMQHQEQSWKYDAQRRIFWRSSRVFHLVMNTASDAWYFFPNKIILEGEIKDAKLRSFSSDFQILIKI